MALNSAQLQETETTICQAPALITRAVLSITFCNVTSVDKNITMYAYTSTGSAGDGTCIVKNYTVEAYDTFIWSSNEKFILYNYDKISGLCNLNDGVTATANYYDM